MILRLILIAILKKICKHYLNGRILKKWKYSHNKKRI